MTLFVFAAYAGFTLPAHMLFVCLAMVAVVVPPIALLLLIVLETPVLGALLWITRTDVPEETNIGDTVGELILWNAAAGLFSVLLLLLLDPSLGVATMVIAAFGVPATVYKDQLQVSIAKGLLPALLRQVLLSMVVVGLLFAFSGILTAFGFGESGSM